MQFAGDLEGRTTESNGTSVAIKSLYLLDLQGSWVGIKLPVGTRKAKRALLDCGGGPLRAQGFR